MEVRSRWPGDDGRCSRANRSIDLAPAPTPTLPTSRSKDGETRILMHKRSREQRAQSPHSEAVHGTSEHGPHLACCIAVAVPRPVEAAPRSRLGAPTARANGSAAHLRCHRQQRSVGRLAERQPAHSVETRRWAPAMNGNAPGLCVLEAALCRLTAEVASARSTNSAAHNSTIDKVSNACAGKTLQTRFALGCSGSGRPAGEWSPEKQHADRSRRRGSHVASNKPVTDGTDRVEHRGLGKRQKFRF